MDEQLLAGIARALRTPLVPRVFEALAACDGYLDRCWPRLAPSVETAGFVRSALYIGDMAHDAVREAYEPGRSPAGFAGPDVAAIADVLDVFAWVQPQTLLICAALADALDVPVVGGQGRAEPRATTAAERRHLATAVPLAPVTQQPLPAIAEALHLAEPPELYRAAGCWPGYLDATWEELQHLAAYPSLRRRGRALYYYARSASRHLAQPLEASSEALEAAGVAPAAVARVRAILDGALPALATMVVHCSAMRAGLGAGDRDADEGG